MRSSQPFVDAGLVELEPMIEAAARRQKCIRNNSGNAETATVLLSALDQEGISADMKEARDAHMMNLKGDRTATATAV